MIILPHYHYWFSLCDIVITINNVAIVIIFITILKWLCKESQSGIPLTFFIEIVDKELLKYEVENIR